MNIVIIGQNEGASIIRMLTSLRNIDAKRIWVLDRCTDYSEELLNLCGETYIKTKAKLKGRQTSYSRNLGLSLCDKDSDVLFLDGDRYFIKGTFKPGEKDISLLLLEEDHREHLDFEKTYGNVRNSFYSCGVFFKRFAINRVLRFQKGKLFREDIQQDWGIEDVYLGDVCYHLGLTCEINRDCRLAGKFEKITLDNITTIKKRFKLRDKLEVKW